MSGIDPIPSFNREQIRRVDEVAIRQWGIPGLVLMENAGRGVADVMCELGIEGKVVIACAKGNNGGDGFVLARQLNVRGFEVEVLLCCESSDLTGDALATFSWLQRCDVEVHVLSQQSDNALSILFESAAWLVDGLLGTGAVGAPRSPLDTVIRQMNAANVTRLAIDLPSGLDCDTGAPANPTFNADHTCTFVAAKKGFFKDSAVPYVGELHCLDIGVPWNLVEQIMCDVNNHT